MRGKHLKQSSMILLILLGAGFFTSAEALENTTTQTNTQNYTSGLADPGWKFEVAPYLWALNMNGSLQLRGARAHVDQTFSDILSQLDWGAMIWAEATHDRFGVFINVLYAALSNGASDRYISANVNVDYGLYAGGLSYEIYKTCFSAGGCDGNFSVNPYVGFRSTSNNTKLTVNTPFGSINRTNNKYWTDPIVGARMNLNMSKSWLAIMAADVGGTNTVSDYSYNLVAMLGFRPQQHLKNTSWYLGYRLLDQNYSTGTGNDYYNWKMKLFGPVVSVSYTFS